jgi:hypothetical protein
MPKPTRYPDQTNRLDEVPGVSSTPKCGQREKSDRRTTSQNHSLRTRTQRGDRLEVSDSVRPPGKPPQRSASCVCRRAQPGGASSGWARTRRRWGTHASALIRTLSRHGLNTARQKSSWPSNAPRVYKGLSSAAYGSSTRPDDRLYCNSLPGPHTEASTQRGQT